MKIIFTCVCAGTLFLSGCVALYHPSTSSTCYLRATDYIYVYFIDKVNITSAELKELHSGGMVVDSGTHTFLLSITQIALQPTQGNFTFTLEANKIYRLEIRQAPADEKAFYMTLVEHDLSSDSVVEQIPFKVVGPFDKLFHR